MWHCIISNSDWKSWADACSVNISDCSSLTEGPFDWCSTPSKISFKLFVNCWILPTVVASLLLLKIPFQVSRVCNWEHITQGHILLLTRPTAFHQLNSTSLCEKHRRFLASRSVRLDTSRDTCCGTAGRRSFGRSRCPEKKCWFWQPSKVRDNDHW